MPLPIAINGVGRVGRALIRAVRDRGDLRIVALNDLTDAEQLARLLERDSFLGPFPGTVEAAGDGLAIDGRVVPLLRQADPAGIPWNRFGARLVIEATGAFSFDRRAAAHLGDGVEHVIVSSNEPQADLTVCVGVNDDLLDGAAHRLVSAASCTTNCLAVMAAVLQRRFGVRRALLNTVHCYNNNQSLLDAPHEDARRARSATTNIIPTTTGASTAIHEVLPELAGRINGLGVRVPAPQVSLVDLVAELREEASVEAVNQAFRVAASGDLAGILAVSETPLVSTDFVGESHSAVVDLTLTQVAGGSLFRVVAWYDNETGYAARLADLAAALGGGPAT